MRVAVDLEKCLGYGNCVADAPEVFEIPEDAMAVRVIDDRPDERLRTAIEASVLDCPARAITIIDD